MNRDLRALTKLMPPPDMPQNADVDFDIVEDKLGIVYPPDFKEFVGVYGSSRWCDHHLLVYPFSHSARGINAFKEKMAQMFSECLQGNTCDKYGDPVEYPEYPQQGGLFLFLQDSAGGCHFWLTKGSPDRWPIVWWHRGYTGIVRRLNMTQMFRRWLERKAPMVKLWGDVKMMEPGRMRLD